MRLIGKNLGASQSIDWKSGYVLSLNAQKAWKVRDCAGNNLRWSRLSIKCVTALSTVLFSELRPNASAFVPRETGTPAVRPKGGI